MLIIKIEANDNGLHLIQSQSHRAECWLDGYIEVPQDLKTKVMLSEGYCDLIIENDILVDIIPKDKPERVIPEVTEEITATDILNALTGGVE